MEINAKIYQVNSLCDEGKAELLVTKEFLLNGYKGTIVMAMLVGCGGLPNLQEKEEHWVSLIDASAGFRHVLMLDFGMTKQELDTIVEELTDSCANGRCTI